MHHQRELDDRRRGPERAEVRAACAGQARAVTAVLAPGLAALGAVIATGIRQARDDRCALDQELLRRRGREEEHAAGEPAKPRASPSRASSHPRGRHRSPRSHDAATRAASVAGRAADRDAAAMSRSRPRRTTITGSGRTIERAVATGEDTVSVILPRGPCFFNASPRPACSGRKAPSRRPRAPRRRQPERGSRTSDQA